MVGLDQFLVAMAPIVLEKEGADVGKLWQERWASGHFEVWLNWVVHRKGELQFWRKRLV